MFLKGETQLPPAVVELSGAFMDAWEAHVLQDRFATIENLLVYLLCHYPEERQQEVAQRIMANALILAAERTKGA